MGPSLSLAILSALMVAQCSGSGLGPVPRVAFTAPAQLRIKANERGTDRVRDVALEDYVQATVLSEFAPAAEDMGLVERMLEVQAIISRTYALSHRGRHGRDGYDLCSTTHCQLYEPGRLRTSRWAPAAEEAVAHTARMVLVYDGAPIDALFHSDCGGRTSTASDVWGGPNPPYLRAERDDVTGGDPHTTWRFSRSSGELRRALNSDPRTRVGRRLRSISVVNRDAAGRAQRVSLRGELEPVVRGEDLREVLTRAFGSHSIRSTWFTVSSTHQQYVFVGRGYGHGVGLCQAGALARLRQGESPLAVLRYYFPGTTVASVE
jgi:stage II sporulation protein D